MVRGSKFSYRGTTILLIASLVWLCSTHSKKKKKRLHSHGCKRGEALLPVYLLACSLNSSSGGRVLSLKTNQVSHFCLKTNYPTLSPFPQTCGVLLILLSFCIWNLLYQTKFHLFEALGMHVLLLWVPYWFPRLSCFLFWALTALFSHIVLHGFVYICASLCRLWVPGGQDHNLFIFCYLTSSLGSGSQ